MDGRAEPALFGRVAARAQRYSPGEEGEAFAESAGGVSALARIEQKVNNIFSQ
jgi:hypothetical protein